MQSLCLGAVFILFSFHVFCGVGFGQCMYPEPFTAGFLHNEIVKKLEGLSDPDPYHYLASLGVPASMLSTIRHMDEEQVIKTMPISSYVRNYLRSMFVLLEQEDLQFFPLWDQIKQDPLLTEPERQMLLQVLGLLQMSFWHWRQVFQNQPKAPLGKIVKADGLGFLKGLLFGLLFFALYDLNRMYSAVGIIGGSAIVVLFSAGESYLYARKYPKSPEPDAFYE